MPAIYTFSLDFTRDREIIDLLESKKNRSDFIRTLLRQESLLRFYMDLFDDVYGRYSTAMFMQTGTASRTMTKEDFMKRRRKLIQEEE